MANGDPGPREIKAPRWLAWLVRAPFRLFGHHIDAITLPLPFVILYLKPYYSITLQVHEWTHAQQIANCWPRRGPLWYRKLVGGFVAMATWLWLWLKARGSYRNHRWEIEARQHAGQE